jgi:uncharacterized membrane protein YhfC
MLYLTYSLNALLMMALPVGLGIILARHYGLGWRLFWIGAVTFVASQAVHIPLNIGLTRLAAGGYLSTPPAQWKLLTNAVILGLTAGLCEETARYLVYRWWIKPARTWREGLMFGAGHGGVEAIIFGALAGLAFVQLAALQNVDLNTLGLSAEQLAALQKQIAEYWSAPWYASLLGAVERAFALCFHLSAAIMVLQVFRRRNILWLAAAILWHTVTNAIAVYVSQTWGIYAAEAVIAGVAVMSLGLVFALRGREPVAAPTVAAASPAIQPLTITPVEVSKEKLDETRYQ